MFDLRRPCGNCPWRTDIHPFLTVQRVVEILQATAFQCHKTIDYEEGKPIHGDKPQQCAGLMLLLHRAGHPNTIMQVAERTGYFNPDQLDQTSPVYNSLDEAVLAHGGDPDTLLPRWMRRRDLEHE